MIQRYIFLDVDGVLNNRHVRASYIEGATLLPDAQLEFLAQIVDATQAKLVIDSTWRLSAKALGDLSQYLHRHRMKIFSCTPDMDDRVDEIRQWLI